jgi:hypothetical protein
MYKYVIYYIFRLTAWKAGEPSETKLTFAMGEIVSEDEESSSTSIRISSLSPLSLNC